MVDFRQGQNGRLPENDAIRKATDAMSSTD